MRSAPPAPPRLSSPEPLPRLPSTDPPARLPAPPPLNPPPDPRLLARLPPCRLTRCCALERRCDSESPRALPPNLSAVARSLYGVPPRCSGLWLQLLLPPPTPLLLAGRLLTR